MSDVKKGWLKNGSETLAPNTFVDQVLNSDGTKFKNDFDELKETVKELDEKGFSADGAELNQVPTANGDGTWEWKNQQGGSGDDNRFSMDLDIVDDEFMNSFEINYQDSQDPPRVVIHDHIPNLEYVNNMFKDGRQIIKGEYYSEEETIIGRWTDGKPLYQKTVIVPERITLSASKWTTIATNVIDATICYPITTEFGHDDILSDNRMRFRIANGNLEGATTQDGAHVENLKMSIKYTKTTDTEETPIPESVLPTSLIKGDNYSTEEQVVGRWVDGRPLYRRTYDVSTDSHSHAGAYIQVLTDWTDTDIDSSFMDTIVSCKTSNEHNSYLANVSGASGKIKIASLRVSSPDTSSYVRFITLEYTKMDDTSSTPIQTSLLNSDEIQSMIDTAMGNLLGGEG